MTLTDSELAQVREALERTMDDFIVYGAKGYPTPAQVERIVAALRILQREGEVEDVCGDGDGERSCQLAAGHEGDHAQPADDLSYVETWPRKVWVQCTAVTRDCLGGCRNAAEHERYNATPTATEREKPKRHVCADPYCIQKATERECGQCGHGADEHGANGCATCALFHGQRQCEWDGIATEREEG